MGSTLSCETHPTTESGNQVSGAALLVMHAISQCNLIRADQEWAPLHWHDWPAVDRLDASGVAGKSGEVVERRVG